MRKLIISTIAAASIAAISGVAGAQQQSGDPVPPDQIGPSAAASAQADDSTSADANVSTTSSSTSSDVTTTTTGAGASVDFQGAEAAPTPPASYPICKGKIQDECVNPREAGLNYGNRPLKYWPGHPASQ